MSGRDYRLGRVDLQRRAERIPTLRTRVPPESDQQLRAWLQATTQRTLDKSRNWRAGRPLADHRSHCDCPKTMAGCTERWAWPTIGDVGHRNIDNRQGRKLGPPDRGQP